MVTFYLIPLNFHEYGVLSDRKLEEQIKGTRIKVESYKKNSNDFILWKPSLVLSQDGNLLGAMGGQDGI